MQHLENKVKTVSADKDQTACIMENSSVIMFGQANLNTHLQIIKPPNIIPVHALGGEWPVQVVCHDRSNCVLTESGKVFATILGERINENDVYVKQFIGLRPGTGFMHLPVRMLAVGAGHVPAIGQQHGMWAWGMDSRGTLGL